MINLIIGIFLGGIGGIFSIGFIAGAKIIDSEAKMQRNNRQAQIGQATEKAFKCGHVMGYQNLDDGNLIGCSIISNTDELLSAVFLEREVDDQWGTD